LYNESVRREAIARRNELADLEEKQVNEAERLKKIEAFELEIGRALEMSVEELERMPHGLKAAYYRHLDKNRKVSLSNDLKIEIYNECDKLIPKVKRSELSAFDNILHANKKRDAYVKELAQSKAFEVIRGNK
jgi:hypothetical protein